MNDDAEKAPTRMLLTAFDRCHQAKLGVPAYPLGGKQAAILAGVWKIYGTDLLMQIIGEFFEGNDFADDCGYSVPVFASQVPRMLMQIKRRESGPPVRQISDHEFFRIHGYRRSKSEAS